MKNLKKMIPTLLACMFLFSSCVTTTPSNSSNSSNSGTTSDTETSVNTPVTDDEIKGIWKDNENVVFNDGAATTQVVNPQRPAEEHLQTENRLHKVNVTETNKPFIVNGKTDYKILLPANASTALETGAAFLVKHLRLATSCLVQQESAESYTWDPSQKWIVLGRTELFTEAGLTMPEDDLGISGYYIKTVGNTVFAETIHDNAWQRVALALLDHLVGYELYWTDTVVYEKTGETLPDMDIIERPDFTLYQESNQMEGDGKYAAGFNLRMWIPVNGHSFHNTFVYLPKSEFGESHWRWYSVAGTQLCYTARGNQEEWQAMVETLAERVLYWASLTPDLTDITITHEDDNNWCGCTTCTETAKYYNGSNAAVVIKLLNAVDDIVQARLQAEAEANGTPKRLLKIAFFGYRKTEKPPTKQNADGTHSPVDESVICNPNVAVYIAAITSDYDTSFYSKENTSIRENVKGWNAVCETIYMWIYDTNFNHYFFPNNTWDSKIETYRFLKEHGAYYMHSQSQHNTGAVSHFSRFKDYIDMKASFDVNVNYLDLKNAWFKNYFGPAEAPMRQFFDQLETYMEYLFETYGSKITGNTYKETIAQAEFWPKKLLDGYLDLVDKAYQTIEPLKASNPDMYEIYRRHIVLESLFPRAVSLHYHSGTYNSAQFTAEALSFKQDCMDLGLSRWSEGQPLADKWASWGV